MGRNSLLLVFLLSSTIRLSAEEPRWNVSMDEVTITSRKLTEMGVTKTVLDSVALRGNVVHSLADVLAQNTSVFIKSYGRGTLATASFRGTAPSHTQVLWNGMSLNSPMLGMVDFSLIPSYFIDQATLYHGAGSVGVAGGGLGGAVTLGTKPSDERGFGLSFIQGVSSFHTYDEFLHVTYGNEKFQSSTRFCYVNSKNDFKYKNYDKIGDDNVLYPTERNKNGSFRDWHLLQELYYQKNERNKFGLTAWLMDSRRGIPMLSVSYREEDQSKNRQDETTLRMVGSWDRTSDPLKMGAKLGFTFSDMLYRQWSDLGGGHLLENIHDGSQIYTGYGQFAMSYAWTDKWLFSANAAVYLHAVNSRSTASNSSFEVGYDKQRVEASAFVGVKYRPHPRVGFGVDLRGESYGRNLAPLIPAAFADFTLWPKYNVIFKASVAKNYRYPSLNDLYFQPGGNDSLRTEKGYTYEGGLAFGIHKKGFSFTGEGTLYNAHIRDWILWLPTFKGFWSPVNVKKVHSYGVELKGSTFVRLSPAWSVYVDLHWARTRSLNYGDQASWTDESIGKQLVYVPEYSSSITGRLCWRDYSLTYKYSYYSERFTTSSNETNSKLNRLGAYYMNDVYVERRFSVKVATLSVKFCVYNLLNEHYVSVLSRPMAGRNFGLFLGITPKW